MKKLFTILTLTFAGLQSFAQCNAFYDGFESGTFLTHWTLGAGYTQSVNTTSPAVGTYSLQHTGSSGHTAGSYASFTASQPDYISYRVKSDNGTSANAYFVVGDAAVTANNSVFFAYITSTNQMRFYGATGQNFPINLNQWYHIELKNINWSSKTMDVYMDGSLILPGWPFRDNTINSAERIHIYNLNTANASYDEIIVGGTPLTGTVNNTICSNDTIIVNGTQYHAGNPTGTEIISNVGPNNCDSTVTINLTALPPIDTSVTTASLTLTSNETGATYRWLDCDNNFSVIAGETGQSFTASVNGNYAVEVTVGSCTDTSACVNISSVGISEGSFGAAFNVYPNPTDDIININLGAVNGNVNVRIFTLEGKKLYQQNLNGNTISIDLSDYSKGVYILKISDDKNQHISRIFKQ